MCITPSLLQKLSVWAPSDSKVVEIEQISNIPDVSMTFILNLLFNHEAVFQVHV